MTSSELLNKRFDKAMNGYKTSEVEAFLAEAATAFSKLSNENTDLKHQMTELRTRALKVEEDKDSLRNALLNAQKFADSLARDAQKQADEIIAGAQKKAGEVLDGIQGQVTHEKEELTRVKTEVATFRSKMLDMYRAHLELIGAMPSAADIDLGDEPKAPCDPPEQLKVPEGETAKQEAAAVQAPAPVGKETAVLPKGPAVPEKPAKAAQPKAAAPEKPKTAPAVGVKAAAQAAPAQAEELPHVPFHLNMRYDERTGEYVPLSADDTNGE